MKRKATPYLGDKLPIESYEALWRAQKGVCAACGQPEQSVSKRGTRSLAVDHCHVTGRVRGLLCGNCNRALGLLHENPERVRSLLRYLQERCLAIYDIDAEIARHYVSDALEIGLTDDLY